MWAENIEKNVFDARHIGANLMDWFKEKQSEALVWAMEESGETVKPINNKHFFRNLQSVSVFPCLQLISASIRSEPGAGDVTETTLTIIYSITLLDGDIERMARHLPIYELAFSSMARNIPKTSLEKKSKINFGVEFGSLESDFDISRPANKSEFIQSLLTQVEWLIDFQNPEQE